MNATPRPGQRYAALGSSFATGPGIRPRVAAAPRRAGRSRRNYAHLLAERLGLELHDVTCSGAAAAGMRGATAEGPGQVEALTRDTALVTVTCGGNDVGYVGALTLASLPRPVLGLPAVRRRLDAMMSASDERFTALPETLDRLYAAIRERAPEATLVVVDYLTILPPPGRPARPVSPEVHGWGLEVAARLEEETAAAARRAGAVLVRAGAASQGHHAWSDEPWTSHKVLNGGEGGFLHPTAAGMAAEASLVAEALAGEPGRM